MRHPLIASVLVLSTAAVAHAQPVPVPVPLPPPPDGPPPTGDPPPDGAAPTPTPEPPPLPTDGAPPGADASTPPSWDPPVEPSPEPPPLPPLVMSFPMIFTAPSGRLLPAAVLWSTSGVHTGGGLYGDLFVGLGDVAEFGVGLTDLIRVRAAPGDDPERVAPFAHASFKMGIGEERLFRHQPAIALAFRKSFEHTFGRAKLRTAALYLMVSKAFGPKVSLHVGGVLVDAALREPEAAATFFHDQGVREQLRPVLAFEAEPLPRSSIMVELNWVPEFTRAPADIRMSALLTWGVRYRITTLLAFESGVRIQGIDEANLLDAQIFGQLSWGSDRLRRAIHRLK